VRSQERQLVPIAALKNDQTADDVKETAAAQA
jgi:hypothetical protein